MKNKTIITGILLSVAIAFFILPSNVVSQVDLIDSEAVVTLSQITDNGDSSDGKFKVILFIAASPTYTFSGGYDRAYYDRITFDISKMNSFDTKIVNSVKDKELEQGYNITKITTLPDKRRIYP